MSFSASPSRSTQPPRGTTTRNGNKNKMLASTIQFSNNSPSPHPPHTNMRSFTRQDQNNNPSEKGRLLSQDPTVCQHQHVATNHMLSNPKAYSHPAGTTTGTIH